MDLIAKVLMFVGLLAAGVAIAMFIYKNREQFDREINAVKKH